MPLELLTASRFHFISRTGIVVSLCAGLLFIASHSALATPACAELPKALSGDPRINAVNSSLVAALGSDAAYCKVDLRYSSNPRQQIRIVLAMPLSAADAGRGGLQGAWNGRTQGLGGAGCLGNLFQPFLSAMPLHNHNRAVNAGYLASGNDLGHEGANCDGGVNADGTYNMQFIQDYIRNGTIQQILWSKAVARIYYGREPRFNYWNACSTGGRQGYLLAQELGDEVDGVLASDPAIYLTRLATSQMWGQIVMRELTGGAIPLDKLEQARLSAIAACDAYDGVSDGIIDDPRTCHFSAKANICGSLNAPLANCLTPAEALAVDRIWDGPRNARGNRIWFGLDRGSTFDMLNGPEIFAYSPWQAHWNTRNPTFDFLTVSIAGYGALAQAGSINIADVTDNFASLDTFKKHRGKLLTILSTNDQGIFPRGALHYYRSMAMRYSGKGSPDFERLGEFYRLYRAPGFGHCGGHLAASEAFDALVKWVEQGIRPGSLITSGEPGASHSARKRPICPYPQSAIYQGSGSTDEAGNFKCGGSLETRAVVCQDVIAKFKREKTGGPDYRGTGLRPEDCQAPNGGEREATGK